MGQVKVLLNTVAVLGSSPVQWSLTDGVRPSIAYFDLPFADANRLGTESVTLTIEAESGKLVVKDLTILKILPGENPYIRRVMVADRRWFWEYAHVLRRFNMRRRVGTKRVSPDDPTIMEEGKIAENVQYAWYSVPNPSKGAKGKWTYKDAIENVLQYLSDFESGSGGSKFSWEIEAPMLDRLDKTPLEGMQLDDRADMALNRLLKTMPMVGLYVHPDGHVVLYDRAGGRELDALTEMTKGIETAHVGGGWVGYTDNQRTRPREIQVLFSREVELRFDYYESTGTASATLGDVRRLENVIPVPDPEMVLADGTKLTMGSWVSIDNALNSTTWANPPGIGIPKLTHEYIQRAMVPEMDLWAPFQLSGQTDPDSNWAVRVAAIQAHYRRTFRMARIWMDRILSIRPYRVGTIDPIRGTRAPAVAFSDHYRVGTQRSRIRNLREQGTVYVGFNVDGWPADGMIGPTSRPSALVTILDEDQGIIHLDYKSKSGDNETVLPSKMFLATAPTEDPKNKTHPIAFNAIGSRMDPTAFPKLSASYKAAIILTAVPGSPNTMDQLHSITVKPEDIKDMLPVSYQQNAGKAAGPPLQVRCHLETARVAWSDAPEAVIAIEAAFGKGSLETVLAPREDVHGGGQVAEFLRKQIVNEGKSGDVGASLNSIARAIAATIYAGAVNRYLGAKEGPLSPKTVPAGAIEKVQHGVSTQGVPTTSVELPDDLPSLDIASLLDAGSRAILFKQAVP